MDKDGQPFALISAANKVDDWSLTSSHELLEMLVDPSGDGTVTGDGPREDRVALVSWSRFDPSRTPNLPIP